MHRPETLASPEGTLSLSYSPILIPRLIRKQEQIETSMTVGEAFASLLELDKAPTSLTLEDKASTFTYVLTLGIQNARMASQKVRIFLPNDYANIQAIRQSTLLPSNSISIPSRRDRTTDLRRLEQELVKTIEQKEAIGLIVLNGGTQYDQAIDDIAEAIKLRDALVEKYRLSYVPHIHVDSYNAWPWLMFQSYNWQTGGLRLPGAVQRNLRRQHLRIRAVAQADSWTIDMSSLTGRAPQPVLLTNRVDGMIAERQADASLMLDIGQSGYQKCLAQLTDNIHYLRFLLKKHSDIRIANVRSDGYIAAIRLVPPGMAHHAIPNEIPSRALPTQRQITNINEYTKAFFKWIRQTERAPYLEFTDQYAKSAAGTIINALLIEADMSFTRDTTRQVVEQLAEAKHLFNRTVWPHLH